MARADLRWMDDASCASMPPEAADLLFFPEKGRNQGPVAAYRKRICGGCPVRIQCAALGASLGLSGFGGSVRSTRRGKAA